MATAPTKLRAAAPSTPARFTAGETAVGTNIHVAVTADGIATITIDLKQQHGLSGSGKSNIVASTGGNLAIPGGGGVVIGLNAYTKV